MPPASNKSEQLQCVASMDDRQTASWAALDSTNGGTNVARVITRTRVITSSLYALQRTSSMAVSAAGACCCTWEFTCASFAGPPGVAASFLWPLLRCDAAAQPRQPPTARIEHEQHVFIPLVFSRSALQCLFQGPDDRHRCQMPRRSLTNYQAMCTSRRVNQLVDCAPAVRTAVATLPPALLPAPLLPAVLPLLLPSSRRPSQAASSTTGCSLGAPATVCRLAVCGS